MKKVGKRNQPNRNTATKPSHFLFRSATRNNRYKSWLSLAFGSVQSNNNTINTLGKLAFRGKFKSISVKKN